MGFLDNVTSAVNKGTASVGRAGRSAQLKRQLNDLAKQRRDICTQLGANLYEITKDNDEFRSGREGLYDMIASLDGQRASIEAELAALEEEAARQSAESRVYTCPRCGASVPATDMFCSGCGMAVAEIVAAAQPPAPMAGPVSGPACPNCGAAMSPGDVFCMSCGTRVGDAQPQPAEIPSPAEPAAPAGLAAPAVQPEPIAQDEQAQA